MNKMTLENEYGSYSVSTKHDDMTLYELFGEVIEPLLLAAGYHPDTIKELVDGSASSCDSREDDQ